MRSQFLKTWFLLVYWVLLVNLGPSLHRAHFFGLHCDHCSDSCSHEDHCNADGHCHASMSPEELQQHLSCCHNSSPPVSHEASDDSGSVNSHHDCAFCRFFGQYHVVFSVYTVEVSSVPAELCYLQQDSLVDPVALDPIARGPPTSQRA